MEIADALKWLDARGVSKYARVVPGPLIRSTQNGHPEKPTHMGLSTGQTYSMINGALNKAYEKSIAMDEPDLELDLEGREKPAFGNHGGRRYSDKKALDTAELTGVPRNVHNDHFGWAQKAQRKDSALHYHGSTERLLRAKVTSLI